MANNDHALCCICGAPMISLAVDGVVPKRANELEVVPRFTVLCAGCVRDDQCIEQRLKNKREKRK